MSAMQKLRVPYRYPLSWATKPLPPRVLVARNLNRWYTTEKKDLNITHSRFIAEAPPRARWDQANSRDSLTGDSNADEMEGVTDTRGKLSPTSSHLFKLILPLGGLSHPSNKDKKPSSSNGVKTPPTVFLLHPSQPLSHVSRLILSSFSPATPAISFRSTSSNGQAFQWSDSTDVGDFIRDAARAAEFTICISYARDDGARNLLPSSDQDEGRVISVDSQNNGGAGGAIEEQLLTVTVPTFADRTRFLRKRLNAVEAKLNDMEDLKRNCDREAHRAAQRMAMGGLGMLICYWAGVARLTFWDFGWDIMEPITYLSGLSTVILGYLWFLYQGREVSYSSVLARSISARREALYKARGFDIESWVELVGEKKALRSEIGRIAKDYENGWDKSNSDHDEERSEESSLASGEEQTEGEVGDGDSKGDKRKNVVEEETNEMLNGRRTMEKVSKKLGPVDLANKEKVLDVEEQLGKKKTR